MKTTSEEKDKYAIINNLIMDFTKAMRLGGRRGMVSVLPEIT